MGTTMKNGVIKIRCSEETKEFWKLYVSLSGSRDAEEALLKLLKDSGWLNKVKFVLDYKKGLI